MDSTSILLGYVDQFRPDTMPIVRAEILACYNSIRCLLDSNAAFNWDWPRTISPFGYVGDVRAYFLRKGSPATMFLIQIFLKFHALQFSVSLNACQ
jgi:hypothetical protein